MCTNIEVHARKKTHTPTLVGGTPAKSPLLKWRVSSESIMRALRKCFGIFAVVILLQTPEPSSAGVAAAAAAVARRKVCTHHVFARISVFRSGFFAIRSLQTNSLCSPAQHSVPRCHVRASDRDVQRQSFWLMRAKRTREHTVRVLLFE